jgi:hypothetical protein
MYRRNFIKATSVTIIGLTASKGVLAQSQPQKKIKVFIGDATNDASSKTEIRLKLTISVYAIEAFSKASETDKEVKLTCIELDSKSNETENTYAGKYKIKSSEDITPSTENSYKKYRVVLSKKSVDQKKCKLPSTIDFDKIKVQLITELPDLKYTIEFLEKNESVFVVLEPDADAEDCFLTTACVATMNKPDDCCELTALRLFRDKYLLADAEGQCLVKEYYDVAPAIVKKINQQANAKQVYADIYNKMILPTIEEINNHNPLKAISIYKNYTYKLKKEYVD